MNNTDINDSKNNVNESTVPTELKTPLSDTLNITVNTEPSHTSPDTLNIIEVAKTEVRALSSDQFNVTEVITTEIRALSSDQFNATDVFTQNLTDNIGDKITNALHDANLNKQIIQKDHELLDKIENLIKNGLDNFASLSQKNLDAVIAKTDLPDYMKQELIVGLNIAIINAAHSMNGELDTLKDNTEVFFDKEVPIIEEKVINFSKKLLSKIKNFTDKTIHNCAKKLHIFEDKIEHIFNDYQDSTENINFTHNNDLINFTGNLSEQIN